MKATQYIVIRALFHLLIVPYLLAIFGNPTKGERGVEPQYEPLLEYILFGVTNVIVQPLLTYIIFNKIKPNSYSLIEQILSVIIGIIVSMISFFIFKPTLLSHTLQTIMCSLGFGVYSSPLILLAYKQTLKQEEEYHFLFIPSMIVLLSIIISSICGSLDTPYNWKYFPTPAFYAYVASNFIADAYCFIYQYYNEVVSEQSVDKKTR
ncbi:hypothetical protein EHI8A_059940 [Entamoeba histolytica HM-1:IMSS-B]|uniref:Uncharacterized protein n=6 Tax=Entamoeba histolytica TaxID=5759 RepID=C4LTC2_ENTH1|nr:hypothetical protein EHI_045070 [Entamoeba histolytica HM-1:IMSS]EMD48911.1 Hypothetical protein EHI5A_027010 [Entamoeba histolytica KU27]EMH74073.1 hypothetical protein EHI8A_059940 [Entamoeba histolytica HM-1:IMSS-B]EMS13638.1 hypothetical protein KM1_112420 [Entamoeba histolytica HM-3:IMSS]ENY60802.1 hypothetical protein EHI7A_058090 [Entamoeba histolytica HM-1:IMSS-A]BAN39275.1 hypothetical protein [Entamoeba histolytica]|eukprot:XP_657252.1 hypothetical protein EHI_045070 [Entamoeba histolytica HM-1:IMSS]